MAWFLPRFESVLRDPESAWGDWQAEYTKVSRGLNLNLNLNLKGFGLHDVLWAVLCAVWIVFLHVTYFPELILKRHPLGPLIACHYTSFLSVALYPTSHLCFCATNFTTLTGRQWV